MIRTRLRMAGVLAGVALLAAALVPVQLVAMRVARSRRTKIPKLFLRGAKGLLRIRTIVHGEPARGPVLFVSNHMSWTDILVLGSLLDAVFVAKAEVADWPVAGALSKIGGVLFVERQRGRHAKGQANAIAERLDDGTGVILFPEGTTTTGEALLPFKSSLFAAAEKELTVQPVTFAYTRMGNRPIPAEDREAIAWIGDEDLLDHARGVLERPPLTAELIFHPPVRRSDFPDRKALARYCQEVVAAGLERLLRG